MTATRNIQTKNLLHSNLNSFKVVLTFIIVHKQFVYLKHTYMTCEMELLTF